MRVLVAGATGVIGRQLVPMLVQAGHRVTGLTRSTDRTAAIEAMGADATVADALDRAAIEAVLAAAEPDAVVHQLTAIPGSIDPRRFAEEFEATDRVRREGTRNLVAATLAAGATRLIAQSIANAYKPIRGWIKNEDDPLYDDAPPVFSEIFRAAIDLEATTLAATELDPIVLRYGNFYGPGSRFADDGSDAELVRRGRFPVAGGGPAHWSFIHVEDAARGTIAALDSGQPGIFNIVDDEPAPIAEWLPVYAEALGAPAPRQVGPPTSDYAIQGMLLQRGASNEKAKRALGWQPRYPSWREGFAADLAN